MDNNCKQKLLMDTRIVDKIRVFLDARILRHRRNFQSNDPQNKIHCVQVDAISKISFITTTFRYELICLRSAIFQKSTFILY